LQTDPPALLLQDGLCHPGLLLANLRLRRLVGCRLAAVLHQVLCSQPRQRWKNRLLRSLEGRFLRSVDAWICNSRTTLTAAASVAGSRRPSLVAPPGGDRFGATTAPAEAVVRAHRPGPLQLVSVANLLPHKGLHRQLAVLKHVPSPKWRLTVAGSLSMDAAYAQRLRRCINDLGLSDRVRLCGPLAGGALAAVLAQSHLMVLPFSHESFGMAYIEGMGFGLPAVGASTGAAGELIRDGENGFLVNLQQPGRFAKIVAMLNDDREQLARLSLAALETFREWPSWCVTLEKIHRFIVRTAG
jgi:glycosyltransferase involved in cell wall biosynthesis